MVEVIFAFSQQDGRSAFLEHGDDVVDDALVTFPIFCKDAVSVLDTAAGPLGGNAESRLSHDQLMLKRSARRLALSIHPVADGPKLHLGDGLVAIAPLRRGGETDEIARLHLRQNTLEGERRQVVAFIDDDVTVRSNEIVDSFLTDEALHHRHIKLSVRLALTTADLPDVLLVDIEEHCQLRLPLLEQRLSVHEDERAARTLRDEVRAKNGLPNARRRHKDTGVVFQQSSGCLLLNGSEFALEGKLQR